MRCCIETCMNSKKMKKSGLSFHKFPYDEDLKSQWLEFIGQDDLKLTNNTIICSDHFFSTDFIVGKQRTKLFPNAVPTNFQRNDPLFIETGCNLNEEKNQNIEDIPTKTTTKLSISSVNEIPVDSNELKGKKITLKRALDITSKEVSGFNSKSKTTITKNKIKIKSLQQNIRRRNKKIKELSDIIRFIKTK